MQIKDIIIIGSGGVGQYVAGLLNEINSQKRTWNVLGFLDEDTAKCGNDYEGLSVLGNLSWLKNHRDVYISIAVSDPLSKRKIIHTIKNIGGFRFASLIHPDAWVAQNVYIGEGVLIYPGVSINVNTHIDDFVTINMGCAIGHDCKISDFATLAPGVGMGGNVFIGEGSNLGIGSVTKQNVTIGNWSVIGAGANVITDIPANITVAGNPARPLMKNKESGKPGEIFILGGGGHAKVVVSTLEAKGYTIAGIFDDNRNKLSGILSSFKYSGKLEQIVNSQIKRAIIAIGENSTRRKWAEKLADVHWETIIHPTAYVHPSASIGKGSVIFAGAVVQPEVIIGEHCIINTGATVDHESVIGDYVHICPGANLGGNVHVGEGTFVGISSTIIQNITIGEWSVIGAGAAVVRDVPSNVTAFGVPARVKKGD